MMTKQDFIALADWIKADGQWYDYDVYSLAEFCKRQNCRFNRDRWLSYLRGECGPNGGKIFEAKATASAPKKCRATGPKKSGRSESKPKNKTKGGASESSQMDSRRCCSRNDRTGNR